MRSDGPRRVSEPEPQTDVIDFARVREAALMDDRLDLDERERLINLREQDADERDRRAELRGARADQRERLADERDQIADKRDREADGRDRVADQRDMASDRREQVAFDDHLKMFRLRRKLLRPVAGGKPGALQLDGQHPRRVDGTSETSIESQTA